MTAALAIAAVIVGIVYAVAVFATWSTFKPMPLAAALGLRRVAFQTDRLVYVSRGPLFPTAVFWFGNDTDQAVVVARAMARGEIPRRDYADAVDHDAWRRAYHAGGQVWPDRRTFELFGDAGKDAFAESRAGVLA